MVAAAVEAVAEPGVKELAEIEGGWRRRANYELFNHNNFNIRYWSWNYRGCWFDLVTILTALF